MLDSLVEQSLACILVLGFLTDILQPEVLNPTANQEETCRGDIGVSSTSEALMQHRAAQTHSTAIEYHRWQVGTADAARQDRACRRTAALQEPTPLGGRASV